MSESSVKLVLCEGPTCSYECLKDQLNCVTEQKIPWLVGGRLVVRPKGFGALE